MKDWIFELTYAFTNFFKKIPNKLKFKIKEYRVNLKLSVKKTKYFIKHFNFKEFSSSFFPALIKYIKRPLLPFLLYKMLMKSFLYWCMIAQGLFLIIFLIFDFFSKINHYIDYKISALNMLFITFMLSPKAIWITLPIAIMFGIIMAISTMYQNNELIAVFTSGVSIYKLVIPIILFNLFLSIFMIFADSFIVIPSFRYRENLFEYLTKKSQEEENITIKGKNNYFWKINKFNSSQNMLDHVVLFKINDQYKITMLLEAVSAVYTKTGWVFRSGTIWLWGEDGQLSDEVKFQKKIFEDLEEDPKTFRNVFKRSDYDIEKMTIPEAKKRLNLLKELGISHDEELLDYYKKFSFPFTLLIVCLFAVGVSTLSQKNILILALFFSIGLAIIYYIMQMILNILATNGKVPPLLGAWLSVIIFLPIAIRLVRSAKT